MFFFQRKDHPDDPPNVRLMKTIKFGGKDLEANRGGFLTDAQRRMIQRKQIWGAVGWWLAALCLGLPAGFLLSQPEGQPAALFLIATALFLVGAAFWQQGKTRKALQEGRAASVNGILSRRIDMVYTGKVFVQVPKIVVGDKAFAVGNSIYNSFIEGEDYTLYYVPQTDQLLSAELTTYSEKEKRLDDQSEDPITDSLDNISPQQKAF